MQEAIEVVGGGQVASASSVLLSVTSSAQQVTLPSLGGDEAILRIVNIGTQTVFVQYNNVAVAVSGTAMGVAIPAGTTLFLRVPKGTTILSAIAGAAGSTIYITPVR